MLTELPFPSLIAEATRIQGDVTFFSAAQIFGTVEGTVYQQALEAIHVGKNGWIAGSICSQGPVVIEGRVEGEVVSATKIQLLSTATVTGKLHAPVIQIRSGAIFEGTTEMAQNTACVPARAA